MAQMIFKKLAHTHKHTGDIHKEAGRRHTFTTLLYASIRDSHTGLFTVASDFFLHFRLKTTPRFKR